MAYVAGNRQNIGIAKTVESVKANYFVENIELNLLQATSREVFLQNTPSDPSDVTFIVIGGTSQIRGLDFEVSGNKVFWGDKALETVLEEGDRIQIGYVI